MSPDCRIESPSLAIHFPSPLIAEIGELAMQGFGRYSWGGPECGGVLLGTHEEGATTIAAYRPLRCEHAEGPAFALSEKDEAGLQELFEAAKLDPELEGLEPVGWYHSVYEDLYITRKDSLIHERHFPEPWKIIVILRRIKSAPPLAGFYVREGEGVMKLRGQFPSVTTGEPPPVAEAVVVEPAAPEPVEIPAEVEQAPEPEEAAEAVPDLPPAHAKIITTLLAGIQARKGFLLLTAEPGSEKQELLSALMNRFGEGEILCAYLAEPASGAPSFFEQLAWELGLVCDTDSKPQVLFALNDLLAREASEGRATVLIVDGAERLPAEVLHEIKMFEMLQNRRGKLLQVILCGTPEMADRLDEREFIELKHQIGVRCALHDLRFVKYN
jgi:hypothetical protein